MKFIAGSSVCNFYLKEYKTFSSGCFEGIIDFQTTEEYCNGGFANFRTKVCLLLYYRGYSLSRALRNGCAVKHFWAPHAAGMQEAIL